jgi:hypothetical protein
VRIDSGRGIAKKPGIDNVVDVRVIRMPAVLDRADVACGANHPL